MKNTAAAPRDNDPTEARITNNDPAEARITNNDPAEARIRDLERRLDDLTRLVSDWVWEVDADLRFTSDSDRIFEVSGYLPLELIGKSIEDIGQFTEIRAKNLDELFRHPFRDYRYQIKREEMGELTFHLSSLPVFDRRSGEFLGARGTASDVTDRIESARTITESEERYRLLVERFPYAITVVVDHIVQFANAPAIKLFGAKSMAELVDRPSFDFIDPSQHNLIDEIRKQVLGTDGYQDFIELNRKRLDGSEFISINAVTAVSWEGKQAILITIQDITESKQAEELMAQTRLSLEKAQKLAHVGSWERDLKTGSTYISPELRSILGLNPSDEDASYSDFLDCIHANDRDRFVQIIETAAEGGAEVYSGEYRIQRPDGSLRNIIGSGEINYASDGAPEKMTGTAQDITVAKRIQAALEAAKMEAENANRAKSGFLSSMSHELRTPMNAILGYGQLLLQNKKEPVSERQDRQINQILKSGGHLLELINDILDLSKIESGKVGLSVAKIIPKELLGECLALVTSLAERNQVELIDNIDDDAAAIYADPVRVTQVLLNLLSNAIKFNHSGGTVEIGCSALKSGYTRMSIQDTGIGIPEERAAELFEPFNRLGADRSGIEGTGIGLTITKQLIERMDGNIGYSSTPGKGTTFWIDLPAVAPRAMSRNVEPSAPEAAAPNIEAVSQEIGALRQVLYIEDDASNLQLMEELMGHRSGLKLISAQSAEAGIEIAETMHPDVIIMDINLPGMNGLDALKVLKEKKSTRSIPVIALSAAAMAVDIEKGEQAGFYKYMTKPVIIDDILKTIDEAVDQNGEGNRH
ncbi:MAG: PAS domain S-box protein [Rhodospirillales bacterium]|nr:PAS domain S-box protein [Rhodospirillales bacterium]